MTAFYQTEYGDYSVLLGSNIFDNLRELSIAKKRVEKALKYYW